MGGSVGVAVDTKGTIAVVATGAVNGTTSGASVHGGVGVSVANGTVTDQRGTSGTMEGSYGPVTAHGSMSSSTNGSVTSVGVTLGPGAGTSVSAGVAQTKVVTTEALEKKIITTMQKSVPSPDGVIAHVAGF